MAKSKELPSAPMSQPTGAKMGKFEGYHVHSALDTIQKAHEHMADPEMMSEVQKLAKKRHKALGAAMASMKPLDAEVSSDEPHSIAKLNQIRNKKFSKL